MAQRKYADGLMDALVIVSEASGQLKLADFSEATWKMLCEIQMRLSGEAGKAFEDEAGDQR